MNDREQLLEWKRKTQEGPQPLPPTQQDMVNHIVLKAKYMRLFYDTLIQVGFTNEEALKLTASAEL